MPFVFRLERVLSVRRIQEETAQQRQAEARSELLRSQGVLEEACARLRRAQEDLDERKRRDDLTSEALHLHSLHVAGQRQAIERAREAVSAASKHLEEAREALLEAHRAREALERLREREEITWKRREARQEARAVDEIAVSRHRAREEENHGP